MVNTRSEETGVKPTNCKCSEVDDLLPEDDKYVDPIFNSCYYEKETGWEICISEYENYGIVTTYYSPDKCDSEIICKNCVLEYKEG
jgi:hypothetical protein